MANIAITEVEHPVLGNAKVVTHADKADEANVLRIARKAIESAGDGVDPDGLTVVGPVDLDTFDPMEILFGVVLGEPDTDVEWQDYLTTLGVPR